MHSAEDDEFLLSVYAASRPELTMLGWSDGEVAGFVRMQFDAQSRHFAALHPTACTSVIEVDGEPAGRLVTDRSKLELRILDLALLPGFRRRGVGSEVVVQLCDEADADGLLMSCHVVLGNEALRFWERAGFVTRGLDGAHLAMERACVTSPR